MASSGRTLTSIAIFFGSFIVICGQTPYPPQHVVYGQGPWSNVYYGQQPSYGQQNYNPNQQPRQHSYGSQPSFWSNYHGDNIGNYNPKDYEYATFPPSFRYDKPHMPQSVSVPVRTSLGTIVGRVVYLYDGPSVSYAERPGAPGHTVAFNRFNVTEFIGIPYARPPVGDLRFRPPERYGMYHSYDATVNRAICPQPVMTTEESLHAYTQQDENCLYLNIYVPHRRQQSSLPVMIYIHGGEFEVGSGKMFPGHMLAASQQVIVVTFNYRLGALGFLSTGDDVSPGNYGMLDQVMAINWVYEQINFFGGDRYLITLFGPGAGAASAGLHMVSPLTRKLIKRVIGHSGSPMADWAAITNLEKARNTSRIFAKNLGCATESSQRIFNCLKTRSYKEFTGFSFTPELGFFPWAPVVDKDIPGINEEHRFLPETPRTLLLSRLYDPPEYMAGVTEDEAAYLILKDPSLIVHSFLTSRAYVDKKIKEYILQYNYTLNSDGIYQAIFFMYNNWADPYNEGRLRSEYIDMMSDALFKAPVDDMVKLMLDRKFKLYMYVLNSTVEGFHWEKWRRVPHDTEYYFVSGAPFMEPDFYPPEKLRDLGREGYTEEDRYMSNFFMTTFANFAKDGQPTPIELMGILWNPMERQNENTVLSYLNINTIRNTTMQKEYRQRECAFWTRYLPTLIGNPPPTTPIPMEEKLEFQIGFYSAIVAAVLFFLFTLIACAMYCSSARRRHDYYYDDDYSNNHADLSIINEKNETKLENQKNTQV